jgi:hypothetical protein
MWNIILWAFIVCVMPILLGGLAYKLANKK